MKFKYLASAALLSLCLFSGLLANNLYVGKMPLTSDAQTMLRSFGNHNAPLRLVEYIDYECDGCRQATELVDAFSKKHPSKVYVELHFYPLIFDHVHSMRTALLADCAAGQGKFWGFHRKLLEKQKIWSDLSADNAEKIFRACATEAGLDVEKLEKCAGSPQAVTRMLGYRSQAKALGLDQTPTIFVNDKRVVGFIAFKEELDRWEKKL